MPASALEKLKLLSGPILLNDPAGGFAVVGHP